MEGVKACSAVVVMAVMVVVFIAPTSTGMKMGTDATEYWLGSTGNGCKGKTIGACLGDEELAMDSEVSRRVLGAGDPKYLSYGSLDPKSVPCNIPGVSYSNCNKNANPYDRGCVKGQRCRY